MRLPGQVASTNPPPEFTGYQKIASSFNIRDQKHYKMSTLVNLLKSIVSFFLQVFFFVISLLMYIPGASTFRSAAITFMTEYRGWFVIFFVLPISLTFDLFFAIRARFIMAFFSAPELHEERVGFIQKQLRDWAAKNDGTKLCTARGGGSRYRRGIANTNPLRPGSK